MTVSIVGVSGKAGSGKDTLVSYLRGRLAERGIDTAQVAFASSVKDFGQRYFGQICDPVKKDPVSRLVLQGIGHMMREEVGSDFWVNKTRENISILASRSTGDDFVVFLTDVRYKNEARSFLDRDKFLYLGPRNTDSYLIRLEGRTSLAGEAAKHASEVDLDDYNDFHFTYTNESSLEDLYKFGDAFLERIRL